MNTNTEEPITEAQMKFLLSLMVERASIFGIERNVESARAYLTEKSGNITKSRASQMISTLKEKPADEVTTASQSEVTFSHDCSHIVGAGITGMTRIIANKYAKPCELCGHDVAYNSGLAVLSRSGWSTWHCKGECIEPAKSGSIIAKQIEEFIAEKCSEMDTDAYFALPSHTGNNDLDFYGIVLSRRKAGAIHTLKRVIGGAVGADLVSNSPVMSMTEAKRVIDTVTAMSWDEWEAAQMQFAQNLSRCYICNRTLTDDASRARGVGSECAKNLG
jgi:hypothetical protein